MGGAAVYGGGPTPEPRTLLDVLDATLSAHPDAPALDDGTTVLDYRSLAAEVRRRATQLRRHGLGVGDRVGVRLPSGNAELYLTILAVLAAGAAYVPVDVDDPDERAAIVWEEADVSAVVTMEASRVTVTQRRIRGHRQAPLPEDDAWIIFTSGSTGKPKGVAVSHRSAAAFADAEARLFLRHHPLDPGDQGQRPLRPGGLGQRPLGPGDRVLAGLSVAFDASCEEMWLAWRHGACLVPAPRALVRSGADLGPWLAERRITVVSTVPTLAALWPADAIAGVRLLILGGEACPAELAARLAVPGREVWNTYGPTEATVVACAAPLDGRGPVRIGLPLDGWLLAVVDRQGEPVGWGETGELVIGGVGLARYLDQAKDAEKYAPLPSLGWDRAYRSGDLVRADPEGLVFAGRADDQVKIGGRRIELGEVDAALAALPGVAAAASAVRRNPAGSQVLAGYLVAEPGGSRGVSGGGGSRGASGGGGSRDASRSGGSLDLAEARRLLSERLPAALVPVLIEVPRLPVRTSGKVDRAALPWPPPGASGAADDVGVLGEAGEFVARQFRELLGASGLGPDSDFFALGGGSLTAAQLVTALRTRYPTVSVADLYAHPVLADLVRFLQRSGTPTGTGPARRVGRPSRRSGMAVSGILALLMLVVGLRWTFSLAALNNVVDMVDEHSWAPRTSWWLIAAAWAVLFSAPGRMALASLGARLLLGGVRPGVHRRGGATHIRLWTAEHLAALCRIGSLVGTPWAGRYARMLGCEVGAGVYLHSAPPVTGMAAFGDGCAVEPGVDLAGWWLDGDMLHLGSVRIGPYASIGARSTLLPGANVGGHAEVLPGSAVAGAVPAGCRWAGSPGRVLGPADGSRPRPLSRVPRRWRFAYALALTLLPTLSVLSALPGLGLIALLIRRDSGLGGLVVAGLVAVPFAVLSWMFCYAMLLAAATRLAGRRLRPSVFPTSGGMAFAAWLTTALTEAARGALFPLYASLATPGWLRLLGARVGRNVEASTVHLLPSLTSIGDQSFLADDTLVAPYELRGGWMRLGRSRVGRRAFVGNSGIVGPGRAVGDGGLIGVLSQTPPNAAPGTSWLGQPPMPVPRQIRTTDSARTYAPPRRLVIARGLVESCRVFPLMLSAALGDLVIGALDQTYIKRGLPVTAAISGMVLFVAGIVACLLASLIKWVLVGRSRPAEHPLWSSWVWRNELADVAIEELAVPWLAGAAMGTPLLNAWLRTLGARIGRGAWIETYWLPEPDLITIGAGASVNRGVVVQTHLFHDRIMQLDRTTLEAGATLGPHSIVLPAATVGRHALVGPASLVMRGESVPAGTAWSGNPVAPMEIRQRAVPRRPTRRVLNRKAMSDGRTAEPKVKAQTVK